MAALMDNGVTRLTRKLCTKFATLAHTHAASDITSGALAIARGGTNASTAADARTNLGVPSDSSIAYVESVTAKTNHAVGDYFMLGGVLMKATAAIATGETINASKATPATVQGQIDTLRDSVGRMTLGGLTKAAQIYTNTNWSPFQVDLLADISESEVFIVRFTDEHGYLMRRTGTAETIVKQFY